MTYRAVFAIDAPSLDDAVVLASWGAIAMRGISSTEVDIAVEILSIEDENK